MVEYKDLQVKVTKEAYEVGEALKKVAAAIQKARADGWDSAVDIPQIVMESVGGLIPALDGYDKIPEEYKVDAGAAIKGFVLPVMEIAEMFFKKEEAPVE